MVLLKVRSGTHNFLFVCFLLLYFSVKAAGQILVFGLLNDNYTSELHSAVVLGLMHHPFTAWVLASCHSPKPASLGNSMGQCLCPGDNLAIAGGGQRVQL